MSYVYIRSCTRSLGYSSIIPKGISANRRIWKISGSLDVEETCEREEASLSTDQLVNSVARVTLLDKQLSAATMETAVMVIAIHYSYHQLF